MCSLGMLPLCIAALLSASSAQTYANMDARGNGGDPVKGAPSQTNETFRSGNEVVQIDRSGKGAVMCIWGFYEAVKTVGLECHKGEDVALQAELKQSVDRIDRFIIVNSKHPVTEADLDARRAVGLKQMQSAGNLCVGDGERLYQVLRANGVAALHAQTDDLLSVSREPVMNPCL